MLSGVLPEIAVSFDPSSSVNGELYLQIVRQTLEKILPQHLFSKEEGGGRDQQEQVDHFDALLPYVTWVVGEQLPCNISFFSVSRYRSSAFRFFFEMVTHWLIPGKRLNVLSFFAVDFSIPSMSTQLYTLTEVALRIEDPEELMHILDNVTALETEIRLGMESSYQAKRILEIRGVSADEKIAFVQAQIAHLIHRQPRYFDLDLVAEMQRLFVMCRDDFKASRSCRHLSRLIALQFLFRKKMKEQVKKSSSNRYVDVKLFRASVYTGSVKKNVLSVFVGVNFLRDKEVFEKHHLLRAIQSHIPGASVVEGSFLSSRRNYESFCHLYLEIEKAEDEKFSAEEIAGLRADLSMNLTDQIEQPIHPVFMPRNEEEVMRHVLVLSSQIKYVRDIPQVVINFDEQTYSHLFFNVIFVQIVKPGVTDLQEILNKEKVPVEYLHERTKTLGFLRNKYAKEAVIFRAKLPKEQFLRKDHSVDLYKARQTVVVELSRLVGKIRDFNGGMIAKQDEILTAVQNLMSETQKYNEHLLENFFFSLTPPVIRTLIEPVAIKTLFIMIQEMIEKELVASDECSYAIQVVPDFVFVVIRGGHVDLQTDIEKKLESLEHHASEIAISSMRVREIPCLGYIYRSDDEQKHAIFCRMIESAITERSRPR